MAKMEDVSHDEMLANCICNLNLSSIPTMSSIQGWKKIMILSEKIKKSVLIEHLSFACVPSLLLVYTKN